MNKKTVFVGVIVFAIAVSSFVTPLAINAQAINLQVESNKDYQREVNLGKFFAESTRDILASTLGLTVEELYSLRSSGKSIEQIGKEKGISKEELTKTLTKEMTEKVKQLFKDGKITADQKERILADLESRMEDRVSRKDLGKRDQGRGKHFKNNN